MTITQRTTSQFSSRNERITFGQPIDLGKGRYSLRIWVEQGTMERTYDGVMDTTDPQLVDFREAYVSTYGNTRGGSGKMVDFDLNDLLNEVACEISAKYLEG